MKLRDQVAIVTGAGRNIGEEISAVRGGRRQSRYRRCGPVARRACHAAINAEGGEAELFVADVAKGSAVAALVEAVVARFGRIDILVNNVAISDNKHIFDITEEEWDRVLAVTLKSQFLLGQHVGRQMAAQDSGGRIVNIGSTSGFMGRSRAVAYQRRQGRGREPHPRHGHAAGPPQHSSEFDRPQQDRLAGRQGRVRSQPSGAQHGEAPRRSQGGGASSAVPGER